MNCLVKDLQSYLDLVHKVGKYLLKHFLYIQDIDSSKLETIDRKNIIPVTNIMTQECDLLAPCAIGAILDSQSIRELQCLIIAGGANNQLKTIEIDDELLALGIHYVPDILINSGGVIGLTKDILDRNSNQIESDLQLIADRAVNFMKIGRTNKISILQAMSSLAS